ncbi:TolC family protein [Bacteroides faecis]
MSKKRWLIVPLCAALCSQGVFAQTPGRKVLGINEMFRLADENSQSIQTYKTGKETADEALKAAKSQRLPDIGASLSFSYLGDGYLWDRDFKNGQNIPMPHFGNNFALEAQQVIYAGGAINSSITLAELGQQMATLDWQKNRQEIRFLLTGYYLDLYKLNNQIQVLQKNLDLTEQVIHNMEARRTQGTALKNDITRYELQKETLKLQLAKVQDACKIINYQLVTTLHLPAGTEIVPDSTLLDEEVKALAENDWQLLATQSNVGLQQAQLAIQMNKQKVKLERSELLPKIALVAGEHLDGPITIEVPVLDNNFNYWYVGVGIKYNLSSLFKNNKKVRQAKLNMRKAQEEYSLAQEQIENSVQANYVNFLTSFTDLRTQEKSVELANQNYNVTSNRYKNDLALLTDMLDASNMKLSADLGLVNARINVVYSYYKMKYITHTL